MPFPLVPLSRALLGVCIAAVLTLALLPEGSGTPQILSSHVLNHLAAFASISALLRFSWPKSSWWMVIAAAMAFGVLIEILQATFTYDREMSFVDVALNLAGSFLGYLAATITLRRFVH